MNEYPQGIWNATEYFKHLTATNRLAKSEGFTFCSVSGLDGFGLHRTSQHASDSASEDGVLGYAPSYRRHESTQHLYGHTA